MIIKLLLLLLLYTLALTSGHEQVEINEAEREINSMKRTACLILSRYHSTAHQQTIEGIVAGLQAEYKSKYIKKMYAMAVQHCMRTITSQQTQLFFQQNDFDPQNLFHVLDSFDYAHVASDLNRITHNLMSLLKFIEEFDEEMEIKKEESEAQERKDVIEDRRMTIFGLDLRDFGNTASIIYLIAFMGIIGVVLWWGFNHLHNSDRPRKREKKKKNKAT